MRTSAGAIEFDGSPEEVLTYFYDANDRLLREERNFSNPEHPDTLTVYAYQGTQQTHKTVQIGEPVEGTPQWVSQTDFGWNLQGKLGRVTSRSYDATGTQTGGSDTVYAYAPSGDRVSSQTEEWAHVEVYGGQFEDRVRETTTTYLVDPDNFTGYSQVLNELTSTTTTIGTNISHNTSEVTSTIGHDMVAQWINGHIAPLTEVSYGPPMGMYFNGTASLLYDGHGSTRQLSVVPYNSSQAALSSWVTQGYAYDAYGQMLGGSAGGAFTNMLYSGEQFDQRAAMQYLRARYYHAESGRFVGLDSFEGHLVDPASLHKYLYTHADPISGIDPTGQSELMSTVSAMAIGGGLAGGMLNAFESIVWGRPGKDDNFVNAFGAGFATGFAIGAGAGLLLGTAPLLPMLMATGGTSALLGGLAWANGFAAFLALGGILTAEGIQDAIDDDQDSRAVFRGTIGIAGLTLFPMQLRASGVSSSILTEALNGRVASNHIADFHLIDVLAFELHANAISGKKTPGVLSLLWEEGVPTLGYSSKGTPAIEVHPVVKAFTDANPGRFQGNCAEPRAISIFLRNIEQRQGTKVTSIAQAKEYTRGLQIQNRSLKDPNFGPISPCMNGCDLLLREFGIEYIPY